MAGRIPPDFIHTLLARADIVEIIEARMQLKKAGREYHACCPFHNEKTPSFTVSPTKQFYHCFGCGAHGSVLDFLMEYDGLTFVEAIEDLARHYGLPVARETGTGQIPRRTSNGASQKPLYAVLEKAAHWYQKQLRRHPQRQRVVDYLKGRGLSGEVARDFEIGFAPPGWNNLEQALAGQADSHVMLEAGLLIQKEDGGHYDRFRDRVMFPIRDRRGRCIGFGGRVLDDGDPKYLNSPETPVFHKGREIYGLYQARRAHQGLDRILVVEGYMDVVALAQFGLGWSVATLGTAITPDHLQLLVKQSKQIIFCFDGDAAGRRAAWRALETALPFARDGLRLNFMFLDQGEDPDTTIRRIGKDAFEAQTSDSVPLSGFFYENLTRQADIRSMDGQAQLVELARPYLAKLPQGLFRQRMIERLATLAETDVRTLTRHLGGGDVDPSVARPSPDKEPQSATPTLMRRAIGLLLHQPTLARLAGDPGELDGLAMPGARLLQQLLEKALKQPQISSAGLLEYWRGTAEGKQLARLLADLTTPEEGAEAEFGHCMERLRQRRIEQDTERLLEKARHGELADAEKQQLQALIRRHHDPVTD